MTLSQLSIVITSQKDASFRFKSVCTKTFCQSCYNKDFNWFYMQAGELWLTFLKSSVWPDQESNTSLPLTVFQKLNFTQLLDHCELGESCFLSSHISLMLVYRSDYASELYLASKDVFSLPILKQSTAISFKRIGNKFVVICFIIFSS